MGWLAKRLNKQELPVPPAELRELVGVTDAAAFDNPSGDLVFPEIPVANYRSVVDFGCGCGRLARQLAQQRARPETYVGVDIHKGMVAWCSDNLGHIPGFTFHHHDVYNPSFNPAADQKTAALPAGDGESGLLIAWSVFTHLVQSQVEWYLGEVARTLAPDGLAVTTWFLFDRREFPMMQDFQHALYINEGDLTNAVIFDRDWLPEILQAHGLVIRDAVPPEVRGFQWTLRLARARSGEVSAPLPADDAPAGRMPAPLARWNASSLGN